MNASNDAEGRDPRREIATWAGRYARNRTLPAIVAVAVTLAIVLTIGSLSLLIIETGNPLLIGLAIALNVLFSAAILWLLITGRMVRYSQQLSVWLYRKEGIATPSLPSAECRQAGTGKLALYGILTLALPWLLLLVLQHVICVPIPYLQPAMAGVAVPVIVLLICRGRDDPKWLCLVWPALYALHALLILTGVPIPSFGVPYLDTLLPLSLYAMVSLVVAHIYSRYALWRLRILAYSASDETGLKESTSDVGERA